MSASVSIYAESVPTMEHGHIQLDEGAVLNLPLDTIAAARWCADFAALLADQSAALWEQVRQNKDAFESVYAMVEETVGPDADVLGDLQTAIRRYADALAADPSG